MVRVYTLRRPPAWQSLGLARRLPAMLADLQHGIHCPECGGALGVFDRAYGRRLLAGQLGCVCGATWPATASERQSVAACWRGRAALIGAASRACLPLRTARDGLLPTVHDVDGWLALGITDAIAGRPAALSAADPSPHAHAYARGHLLACLALYTTGDHFEMAKKSTTDGPADFGQSKPEPERVPDHDSIAAALVAAQAEARSLARDGHNKHNNFHYATADQVFDLGRALLTKHGLAWSRTSHTLQAPALTVTDIGKQAYVGDVVIEWVLRHAATDDTVEGAATYPVIAALNRPHDKAVGASVTYGSGQIMLGLLCWDREDEHNAINRRGDGDSNSPAQLEGKGRGKGKRAAEPEGEPSGTTKAPSDPWLTDADTIKSIAGKARELAVLEGEEPGDVWRRLLEQSAVPTVIRNPDGSEVKCDSPRKLRVSQAKRLMTSLDLELGRAHAAMQVGESPA